MGGGDQQVQSTENNNDNNNNFGGLQEFNTSIDSSGSWVPLHSWGNTDNQQMIAYGLGWNGSIWTNSKVSLSLPQKISGGSQKVNNKWSSSEWAQQHVWGDTTGPAQLIAISLQRWSQRYSWGNSQVTFYHSNNGKQVVGGVQLATSMDSSKPQVEIHRWGRETDQKRLIFETQAWSKHYGWGNSFVYLFFE
jgi:hypothetical protein